MSYFTDADIERLKKLCLQGDSFSSDQDFADGLLDELFDYQGKSLKDSITLLSGSIHKRKGIAATKTEVVSKRLDQIQVALQQFPLMTCYPHLEARRAHLERERDELLRGLKEEEVSAWKDMHNLHRDLIYLVYKYRTLDTVKRAARSEPSSKG